MKRPICPAVIVALVIALASALGVGPLRTSVAHADAGYCNIYPPSRIALWAPSTQITVRWGEGCARSGSGGGTWSPAILTTGGQEIVAGWSPRQPLVQSFTVSDRTALGEFEWGTYLPIMGDVPAMNEPWSTVKLGAVSYVSAARSGGYHVVTARAYHYSTTARRIVPSGNRVGQLQYRSTDSAVWRPVAGVRLDSEGRATVRTWSPKVRYYRVSFGARPTLFDTVSAAVKAR